MAFTFCTGRLPCMLPLVSLRLCFKLFSASKHSGRFVVCNFSQDSNALPERPSQGQASVLMQTLRCSTESTWDLCLYLQRVGWARLLPNSYMNYPCKALHAGFWKGASGPSERAPVHLTVKNGPDKQGIYIAMVMADTNRREKDN